MAELGCAKLGCAKLNGTELCGKIFMGKWKSCESQSAFAWLMCVFLATGFCLSFAEAAGPTPKAIAHFISQVRALKSLEQERTKWVEPSADFLRYEQEYEGRLEVLGQNVTSVSRAVLDAKLKASQIVMVSDIHSSKLSQKRYLEALKVMRETQASEEIVLVLEFIPSAFQGAIQQYLDGKMGLKQLKSEIRFNVDGRDWDSYSEILREAKKGKFRILGSDLHISDHNPKAYTLSDRDDLAAKLISEDRKQNPQARYLIFYGAYHVLGQGHLAEKLRNRDVPVDLIILNFADEIYLREVVKQKTLDAVDVLQFSEDIFFWNSAPVLERLQAALTSLDQREAVAKKRTRDLDFFDVNCRQFRKDLGSEYLHRVLYVPESRKDLSSRNLRIFFYHKPIKENLPVVLVAGSPIGKASWDDLYRFKGIQENLAANVVFVDVRGTGCSTPYPGSLEDEDLLATQYGPDDIAKDLLLVRQTVDPKAALHWNLISKNFGNIVAAHILKNTEFKWELAQFYGFVFQESAKEDLKEKIKSQRRAVNRYFKTYTGDLNSLDIAFSLFPSQACLQFIEVNICGAQMLGALTALFELRSSWSTLHELFQQLKNHENSEFNRTQILPLSRNFRRNQILKIAYMDEDPTMSSCLEAESILFSKEEKREVRTFNDCGLRRALQPTESSLESKIISGKLQMDAKQSFRTQDFWQEIATQNLKFWTHIEESDESSDGFRWLKKLNISGAEFHVLKEPSSMRFFDPKLWMFPAVSNGK